MKRVALKRKKPMKRTKQLGPGKKTLAKRDAMRSAIRGYFDVHGWLDSEGGQVAFDQVTGRIIRMEDSVAHHKTPRSELRKAGVEDLDAAQRLIICHWAVHKSWVHGGMMGRPKSIPTKVFHYRPLDAPPPIYSTLLEDCIRRFSIIENSPANASNGLCVDWNPQDSLDLDRFLSGGRYA